MIGAISGLPNGFALERGGSVLVANIEDGKVYRLFRDGRHEVVLESFDGSPLGAPNFVYRDGDDRIWITVSTRSEPRREAMERMIPDGYILVLENGTARLAAEGFCFTNEVRIDRARRHLYVAETGKGRVVRLALRRRRQRSASPRRSGRRRFFPAPASTASPSTPRAISG